MQLADHTFIITGGASGLGAATAEQLIAGGAQVVLLDINQPAVEDKAQQLGARALGIGCDICSSEQVTAALAQAKQAFGKIHGLINCAGIVGAQRILGRKGPHDLEAFSRVIEINLIGSFNMLRLTAEVMAANEVNAQGERGVVINTASIAAYDGQLGQAAYAASKGAIASLTLPAARELASSGIRVMTIAPGIFETPMMAGMTEEVRASLSADVPFPPRLGKPKEYAALVQHVIENTMLNGEVIRLDGALRMGIK
ncbi:3-hydroxy-2-methylbutyryl-CoA dehydrogenase [Thiopseudomonas alkaliphila]|uniref:3-hydroxyacyl-CoA dehydrogenase n=1 Tax=Thiopseudomonas alkaliphila TaxID=1697053 RepID=UPI00069E140F|nr:3-hydroxyacyl-CoA dehydrogenase [Thiopseudomonas alkaliphila]AKX48002.1 3-hydroxy-2-methylbutyryl-CoA dehydrogenase [Thiopseudomonas alkaliphila]AKX53138.1 3-hydroxy-2-methylbutyryl-CoA dehydrogenase [Thiopseudomonas alkaliphila]